MTKTKTSRDWRALAYTRQTIIQVMERKTRRLERDYDQVEAELKHHLITCTCTRKEK